MNGEQQKSVDFQEREKILAGKLIGIYSLLSMNKKLNFIDNGEVKIPLDDGRTIFKISPLGLVVPGVKIPESLYSKPSPLPDYLVPDEQIKGFIQTLSEKDSITRLNHNGICYLVDSKKQEAVRLQEEVSQTKWHLYQEESNDLSDWYFLGDKTKWQDPLIEFVPCEMNDDKWRDYWLPHISIDLDTDLPGEEIEKLIIEKFRGRVPPYRLVVVEGNICLMRVRLGNIGGINIYFDLGTATRDTQYHREQLLKQIV